MTRNRLTVLFVVLMAVVPTLFLPTLANARGPQDARDVLNKKVADLMPLLAQSKIDALLQAVGMTSDPDRADYDTQRERIASLPDLGGKYVDFEVVGYKSLGTRYQSVFVLAYYQKMPVLFEFGFYSAGGDWQPLRLHVETNFQTLLDTLPLERP